MTDHTKKSAFFSQWDERLSKLLRDYKDYSSSDRRQKSYSEFLGASFREIMILHEDYAIYKYPTVERALQYLLSGWRMVDEKRFDPEGKECIPRYIPMEADRGSVEPVLAEGIRYYENASDRRRLIIRIELLESPEGIEFMAGAWFVIKREEMEFLRTLLREVGDWAKKNYHLKGKKIKPDGSLLKIPRTYSFDDIILSDEIRGEIEENILDFFKNRENFLRNELPRKRGMILYGEPGVGKTLLGKVLCSQIDCTFIWVTPSRMSLPIEVSHLFEMARELSPTIIFMEDLDFYASNRSEYGGGRVLL